jgi:hypothetical protein
MSTINKKTSGLAEFSLNHLNEYKLLLELILSKFFRAAGVITIKT